MRLGPHPAVVLCGYSALRDALVLQADAFSGRGFSNASLAETVSPRRRKRWPGPPRLSDRGRGQGDGAGPNEKANEGKQ